MTLTSISSEIFLFSVIFFDIQPKAILPMYIHFRLSNLHHNDAVHRIICWSVLIDLFSKFIRVLLTCSWKSIFFLVQTHAAVLRTAMRNNYPQISVLGCGSNKANLYFDMQRQVWVEHLVSSCVEDEKSILQFCQQVNDSILTREKKKNRIFHLSGISFIEYR